MKNMKVISLILSSSLFIAGCSSNTLNKDKSLETNPPTEKIEMLDSSSKSEGKYILSESEKDESKISQDVDLFVEMSQNGKLKVTLRNNSSKEINHGYAIFLEKNIDGGWYRVVPKAEYADEGLTLNPGHEFNQNEGLERWEDNHDPGLLRMVKIYSTDSTRPADETEKYSISNEFELKE